ncbi:MAG: PQQ-binding-like beta-propeller repeat protein [Bacteroidia bacterium]|nr:PQQ-binding-like beta-propeller repeat protein [Bacteroidia bacterium]
MKYFCQAVFSGYLMIHCQFTASAQQSNWTQFRGSNLDGISKVTSVPTTWNDSVNVIWKTRINGKGWSSPVVYGDQVWLTTATEDGKQMSGVCVNSKTGKEIFNIKLFAPETMHPKHEINTYASPTPCIEQGFVYLNFGSYGTACLRTSDGSVVWKRTDLKCDHVQGPGSSPIIYKNLLILHIEGVDIQYIVALDKKTGKTIWKKERPKEVYDRLDPIGRKAYITPIIINVKGKDLLISNGSAACIAYNPETGEEVWRVVQGEDSTISMPFSEGGIVFFYTGFVTPKEGDKYCELLAVDPSGSGDVTKTHVIWRLKSPILQLLTPLVNDGLIYTVDSMNNLFCIDAKTGETVYNKKLAGKYDASPVYTGGNIYFTSTNGETLVIKEGRKLVIIARNRLKGEVFATPAIINNSIIIRAGENLYGIGSLKVE